MGLTTKLAMAMVTSAAGAAMIAGGSFALFTGSATNNSNTFTAGTVAIADYTGGPVASTMEYFNNLAPGDTNTKNVTIKNTGNLDAWVNVDVAATQKTAAGTLFSGATPLLLSYGVDGTNKPIFIKAGASATFPVTYLFPRTAGNSYQGATGSVNIQFDAIQARNNSSTDGSSPTDAPNSASVGNLGNFITPQDFSLSGWKFGTNQQYSGYSIGFELAKPATDLTSLTVDVYNSAGHLLQENTGTGVLTLNTQTLSTPIENDANTNRYSDSYWNYSNWYGTVNEQPAYAIITATDKAGHVYTATEYAK